MCAKYEPEHSLPAALAEQQRNPRACRCDRPLPGAGTHPIPILRTQDSAWHRLSWVLCAQNTSLSIPFQLGLLSNNATPVRVDVTGHSLGAGVASLAAVWASMTWPTADVRLVTFGSPKVGNSDWAASALVAVGRSYRVGEPAGRGASVSCQALPASMCAPACMADVRLVTFSWNKVATRLHLHWSLGAALLHDAPAGQRLPCV